MKILIETTLISTEIVEIPDNLPDDVARGKALLAQKQQSTPEWVCSNILREAKPNEESCTTLNDGTRMIEWFEL